MNESQPSIYQRAAASTAGAIITALLGITLFFIYLVTPLDVVKVRLQLQTRATPIQRAFTLSNLNSIFPSTLPHTSYHGASKSILPINGTFNSLLYILKNEGVSSLWRGLMPALVMSIPSTTIYLLGFEYLKSGISSFFTSRGISNDIINSLVILTSGATSRSMFN